MMAVRSGERPIILALAALPGSKMNRKTVELGVLTLVSALVCGAAFAFDYVVIGAVFGVLACLIGMITFALVQHTDQAS